MSTNKKELEFLVELVRLIEGVFKTYTPLYNRDLIIESIEEEGIPYVVVQVKGFYKYRVQVVGNRLIPSDVWYRDEGVKKAILNERVRKGLYKVLEGLDGINYPVGRLIFKVGKLKYAHDYIAKLMPNGEYEFRVGEFY